MSAVQIGPYRLGKTLGLGAFSRVKLAIHELTGEKVAIKILNRKKLKKMDMGPKVRREIEILKQFDHPHIIRLFEVIDTQTDIYCVMEYVEGGEMFDYIVTKGRLQEDEARSLFQQLISAVDYCHFHMVVHRDLKPENILLDNDTSVKLADFGLSNVMKDGQFLKTSCGSPNYAAPEVITGSFYAGPEVDVWSCGVILYAILCGSLPFDDENIRNLFKKIKDGVLNIPSYVSDDARHLIRQMLIVDPMKRIRVAEIRTHPWFTHNLPPYLAISAERLLEKAHTIDEEVVDAVSQLGFDHVEVIRAIQQGPDLLCNNKFAHLVDLRQMAVTYRLLLDKKRKIENAAAGGDLNQLLQMEEAQSSFARHQRTLTMNALPDSVTAPLAPHQSLTVVQEETAQARNPATKRRWYLGLWSKLDPAAVMHELCRSLQAVGFSWKLITPFKLKARYVYPAAPGSPTGAQTVKMGLQLYRARTVYMIDVQKLHGHVFPFMDLCASVVSEIRLFPPDGLSNAGHTLVSAGVGDAALHHSTSEDSKIGMVSSPRPNGISPNSADSPPPQGNAMNTAGHGAAYGHDPYGTSMFDAPPAHESVYPPGYGAQAQAAGAMPGAAGKNMNDPYYSDASWVHGPPRFPQR